MAEDNRTLPHAKLVEANHTLRRAVMVIAQQRAVNVIKRQYQGQGIKVHQIPRRDIVAAAREYLREHRELIAEAAEIVEQWRKEGFFGKRLAAIQNPLLQRPKIDNEIREGERLADR